MFRNSQQIISEAVILDLDGSINSVQVHRIKLIAYVIRNLSVTIHMHFIKYSISDFEG